MTISPETMKILKDAIHRGELISFRYQAQSYGGIEAPVKYVKEALPIDIDRRMTIYLITKYGDEIAKKIRNMQEIVVHTRPEIYIEDQYDRSRSQLIKHSRSSSYIFNPYQNGTHHLRTV